MAKLVYPSTIGKITGKSAAIWLNENVSPGGDLPVYSSATACKAVYEAYDKSWTVRVEGGGFSGNKKMLEITLPDEDEMSFKKAFNPFTIVR